VTSTSPARSSEVTVVGSDGSGAALVMGSSECGPRTAVEGPCQLRGSSSQAISARSGRFSSEVVRDADPE
jgi:hypothetical protein